MEQTYSVGDSLPDFEEENVALSALLLEISRKAPIHQMYSFTKDATFDKSLLKKNGRLLASSITPRYSRGAKDAELWLYKNVYIYVRIYSSDVSLVFVNNEDDDGESVKYIFTEFEEFCKPIKPEVANTVKVKFWSLSSYGPKYESKFLELPTWEDITRNYSSESNSSLQDLMKLDPSSLSGGGKIILLHGEPGVGKTTIIRALIREWKNWCSAEYIIDPEIILNSSNYLIQVILNDSNDDDFEEEMLPSFLKLYSEDKKKSPEFRLLIFEDTENLISSDDKGSVSPAVSRLLNIGDGLLGQGLKILILLTTNVKLEKLHPALTRPGRTLANIHVPKLSYKEATQWFGGEHKESTLAELYEDKAKKQIITEKKEFQIPGTYL
jgi:hypothetical protein